MTRERLLEGIILTAAALALSFGFTILCGAARAQEISTGYGLFCDTVAEVEYFIALDDLDGLDATNKHFETKACGLKVISFEEGDIQKVVKSPKGVTIHIIEITVVGYYVGPQYKAIVPAVQYSPFTDVKKEEKGVSLPIILVGNST
jgi:hypothetical protein